MSKESDRAWNKAQYDGRVAAGLCTKCGLVPPEIGLKKCRKCFDKHNRWYGDRAAAGVCPRCGVVSDTEYRYCRSCLDIHNMSKQRLYDSRVCDGLCTRCGDVAVDGCVGCRKCLDIKNVSSTVRFAGEFLSCCDAYGGAICANPYCGVTVLEFLNIDHMFGDNYRTRSGNSLWRWLRLSGYPSGYQVLCWNDNHAKFVNNNMLVGPNTIYVCDCMGGSAAKSDVRCVHGLNYSQRYSRRRSLAMYDAYGGPRCVCCGESNPFYLALDHGFDDGGVYRKNGVMDVSTWTRQNDYPQDLGLMVMCANCNVGRAFNGGVCPHHMGKYFGGLGVGVCRDLCCYGGLLNGLLAEEVACTPEMFRREKLCM